jgi:hypothetical protein
MEEGALDLMQKCMNESVAKKRGQKPLFSIFFEFLKIQYQTNFSFIAFREGEGDDEHLRISAAYGEEVSALTNAKLYKRDCTEGDQILWDCLASTEAKVVEDGTVLSIVDDEMLVPFLLTAVTRPGRGEDPPTGIAVVGIALPQLAIAEGEGEDESEGIAKSSIAKSSAVGEEEDEDEVQRREMIDFIKSGASVLGLNLIQVPPQP